MLNENSPLPIDSEIVQRLHITLHDGTQINRDLSRFVFEKLNTTLRVPKKSILSLDVGAGPEIFAFSAGQPLRHIVTETFQPRDIPQEGELEEAVLERIMKLHPHVDWIRKTPDEALERLRAEQSPPFRLITFLNMYPTLISVPYLEQIVTLSLSLLEPEGIFICSTTEGDEDYVTVLKDVERAIIGEQVKFHAIDRMGYKFGIDRYASAVGEQGLLIQKA